MGNQLENLEKRQLLKVARDYEKRGYKVVIEPKDSDLPSFLADFHPDLIAHNETESVVIEIKTHSSLSKTRYIDELASILEDKPSWRFELIVANPKNKTLVDSDENQLLGETELIHRCNEAFKLFRSDHEEAAILLMWSALEAALRRIAEQEKISLEKDYPAYVIKKLYSLGVLDKDQYKILHEGMEIRNAIAHGYKPNRPQHGLIIRLLEVAEQIVPQHHEPFNRPPLLNDRQLSRR